MEEKDDSIFFETDDGKKVLFYVVEQTTLANVNYLLVTDSKDDEANAYLLREVTDEQEQLVYEMVEDDTEFSAVSKIFAELLDEDDIGLEF